jgi:DNA-binding MarR family transcriptional regulator
MAGKSRRVAARDRGSEPGLSPAAIKRRYAASGYDLPTHPAHVLRRAHQRATMIFQQLLGQHDVTPTQMAALATILRHGELSQNRLGRLTAMDPSTISIVVRKLLRNGWAKRSGSDEDQRLTIIRLTPEGERFTADLLAGSVDVGRRVLAPLSPTEQAQFMDMLHRIADGEEERSERKDGAALNGGVAAG